jgi:hypothetical protein
MDCILLQDAPQFVHVDAGLLEDRLRQSRAEDLAGVHGNRDPAASLRVPQLDVRTALDDDRPSQTLEPSDEFGTGEAREAGHGRAG